jgi:OmpA-OmpF porin, OOP family
MKTFSSFVIMSLFLLFSSNTALSQGLLDKIKEKVEEKTDEAIEKAGQEDENKEEAKEQNEVNEQKEEKQNDIKEAQEKPVQKEELKSYSKYDFIPGDKVIFYEDFSQDAVGEFPALWNTNKSGEVMTTNKYPGKWFKLKEEGLFWLEKGVSLPSNCTVEFDVIPDDNGEEQQALGFDFTILAASEGDLYPTMYVPGSGGVIFNLYTPNGSHSISGYSEGIYGMNGNYDKEIGLFKAKELNHVAIWIQKTRVRVYIHGEKIFDLPKVLPAGIQLNQLRFLTGGGNEPLITNIRIAEAGADMRSKLLTEGKLVTHGILFDVNSDKIKPESYGTLKSIAEVLKENADVKVKIVGHTDSDGSDAANLDLSKRRAASVKSTLAKEFGIDESRMDTDGKGESQPVADNNKPEGKANNRRVEFIKL